MRLPLLIPLLALATVVVGRPQCLRSVNAVDLNSPRALAVPAVHAQKRNALAHHTPSLTTRGLGDLGAGAFAGQGASSASIKALQHLLHDWGYDLVSDGIWGPATAGAVSDVQPRLGLATDGVPGPATLGGLLKEVSQGSIGNVVKAAQTALNGAGAALEVDGDFGPGTKAAAVNYQSARGLTADGIVGRNTWTALFGGGSGPVNPPDPDPTGSTTPDPEPTDTGTDPEPTDTGIDPEPTDTGIDPTPTSTTTSSDESQPTETSKTPPVSDAVQADWQVYAHYAAIAKCPIENINLWNCGEHCDWIKNNRGGAPIVRFAAGPGPVNWHQNFYAIELNGQLIISIEGAVPATWVFYVDISLDNPGTLMDVVPDAKIRIGHTILATTIKNRLAQAVQASVDAGVKEIILVGHSQGGSIAEILGVSYQLDFPDLTVTVRAFNQPQSGNAPWAAVVDAVLPGQFGYAVRMNDGIAHEPGSTIFGDYIHPAGEIWLPNGAAEDGWVQCPGRENPACSMGLTDGLGNANSPVHAGPFWGVTISC